MLRGGLTLALFRVLVVRLGGVLRWNPVCLIYRSTTEEQSITTHGYNAMLKHMMTCQVHAWISSYYLVSNLNGVPNN